MNRPSTSPPAAAITKPVLSRAMLVPSPWKRLPSAAMYPKSSTTSYGVGNMFWGHTLDMARACQPATSAT